MKEPLIVRVAPDKNLEKWRVTREGEKSPRAKRMSKSKAVKLATKLAENAARPAIVLVHKTRYIIERPLQLFD